ncbi:MAG: hypothetical protein ABIJ97_16025 [Bacteroidota bacterium]
MGLFAITLRARIRMPMNIPGHHGLEVMALFMLGRSISKIKFASTISSITAGLMIFFPFMGFSDPFMPVYYLLMGITIDSLYHIWKNKKMQLLFLTIIGGLAYLIIPVSRILIHSLSGYPFNSLLKFGYFVPTISHFLFGLAGGLLGAGLVITLSKYFKKQ